MTIRFVTTCATILSLFHFGCNQAKCGNPADCYQKGIEKVKAGQAKDAYSFLAAAAESEPNNANYQWAAARVSPNPKFALFHIKTAWDNGLRNPEIFQAYVTVSSFSDVPQRLAFALTLYAQMPDSLKSDDFRAKIYFNFQQYDSCLTIWQKAFAAKPSPILGNNIVKSYLRKNENANAKNFLKKCNDMKLLDGEGYLLLATAHLREFDYAAIPKIFEDARKNGLFDAGLQVAYGQMLIAQDKYAEAEMQLAALPQPPPEQKNSSTYQQARISLAYIYFLTKSPLRIDSLIKTSRDDLPVFKAEHELCQLLSRHLNDTMSMMDSLSPIVKRMPEYPELNLLMARESVKASRYEQALVMYKRLPDFYLRSPRVMIQCAWLYNQLAKPEEALILIGALHQKNIFSKATLELYRDITYKLNRLEDAAKAQKFLEQRYKDDAGILYTSGVMALKSGKLDSAQAIFTRLSARFPDEEHFTYYRVLVLFLKEDFQGVLRECGRIPKVSPLLARVQARAYEKLGKTTEADSIYQQAIARQEDIGAMLEYADFLMKNKKNSQAADIYQRVLNTKKDVLSKDSSGNAIVLNNLAWSLMQSDNADKKMVLAAAAKACELAPKNPNILDTYANALNTYGKYSDCIKVLTTTASTQKEARLLIHLAFAYENLGDINKAVRTLEDAEQCMDEGKSTLSIDVDKPAIKERIAKLIERIK
jgi:predicted Zn-dependent protease